MVCFQVDDTIVSGSEKFKEEEELQSKSFKTTEKKKLTKGKNIKFDEQSVKKKDNFK